MTRLHRILTTCVLATAITGPHVLHAQQVKAPEVLFRLDDIGMNHSVNLALEQVAKTGMPFSATVLFVCPWYQEAVEILKKYPNVTVGVHLALNSEWRGYRWGPVLGMGGVPSLVDSVGYFLPSTRAFLASKYDLGEVERELSAQVERALKSGLKISFIDAHMGMAWATPQLREVMERVAKKYGLGISTYFGESYYTIWGVAPAAKKSTLLEHLAKASPDTVSHSGDGSDLRHERGSAELARRRRGRAPQCGAARAAVAGACGAGALGQDPSGDLPDDGGPDGPRRHEASGGDRQPVASPPSSSPLPLPRSTA